MGTRPRLSRPVTSIPPEGNGSGSTVRRARAAGADRSSIDPLDRVQVGPSIHSWKEPHEGAVLQSGPAAARESTPYVAT
jgi:hypothetical protein